MTTEANAFYIEKCDVCGRKVDTSKEILCFCGDYKARCRECYVKWVGKVAS